MKYLRYIIALLIVLGIVASLIPSGDGKKISRYRTASVTRGDISQVVSAVGTLNPIEMVNVGTQVSGQITKMHVNISDEVKKGQLLAEIDPLLLDAELKQSQSSLQTARIAYEQAGRDLERTKMLVKKDYVPKVDLERAEQSYISAKNNFETAKVQVDRAKVNLSYTKITSPIDGIIIQQEVTQGQTVAANFQTPNLFKIAGDLTKMKIDVNFSEADISKVKVKQPVKFTVDAFPNEEFSGVVNLVNLNPTEEASGVTYKVDVTVTNKSKKLLPGMTAYVNVILSEKKNVLRIPSAALRFRPQEEEAGGIKDLLQGNNFRFRSRPQEVKTADKSLNAIIYKYESGQPKLVHVRTGATDDAYVEILAGDLQENDKVIIGTINRISE